MEDNVNETVAKPRKKSERYGIGNQTFLVVWETSSSPKEVAEKLSKEIGRDYPVSAAVSKAAFLRKAGVSLKCMDKGREKLDVDSLNAQLAALRGEQVSNVDDLLDKLG